ncbi:MAG: bacteriohemerythrin [Spirochaetota bacterium]
MSVEASDFIQWKDEYATGLIEIDNQHQKLFSILVELYQLHKQNNTSLLGVQSDIARILTHRNDYVGVHFFLEEQVLQNNEYPDLEEHVKKHEVFDNKIQTLLAKFTELKDRQEEWAFAEFVESLLEFLSNWLKNHILVEDFKYKPFVKNI